MKKLYLMLLSLCFLLTACSQYQNKTMVCNGSIGLWNTKLMNIANSQTIGMRIEGDKISLTGNRFQGADEVKVCKIGSIEFAKKDEIYFDTDGCSMTGKNSKSRKYGTFNYITKELNFTQKFDTLEFNQGTFECKDEK